MPRLLDRTRGAVIAGAKRHEKTASSASRISWTDAPHPPLPPPPPMVANRPADAINFGQMGSAAGIGNGTSLNAVAEGMWRLIRWPTAPLLTAEGELVRRIGLTSASGTSAVKVALIVPRVLVRREFRVRTSLFGFAQCGAVNCGDCDDRPEGRISVTMLPLPARKPVLGGYGSRNSRPCPPTTRMDRERPFLHRRFRQ